MKIKTSELAGSCLDYAVAVCEEHNASIDDYGCIINRENVTDRFNPSSNWGWSGDIIEREHTGVMPPELPLTQTWRAFIGRKNEFGPSPLVAAMRCYVASKLGDVVEIPEN